MLAIDGQTTVGRSWWELKNEKRGAEGSIEGVSLLSGGHSRTLTLVRRRLLERRQERQTDGKPHHGMINACAATAGESIMTTLQKWARWRDL